MPLLRNVMPFSLLEYLYARLTLSQSTINLALILLTVKDILVFIILAFDIKIIRSYILRPFLNTHIFLAIQHVYKLYYLGPIKNHFGLSFG